MTSSVRLKCGLIFTTCAALFGLLWTSKEMITYTSLTLGDSNPFSKYKGMSMANISIPVTDLYTLDGISKLKTVPVLPKNGSIFKVDYTEDAMDDKVTIVTAFFYLGPIQKGESNNYYYASTFKKWMQVFSRVKNPLVVYLEDDGVINYFKHLRRDYNNLTRIVKVSKNQLWAFSHLEEIKTLFKSKKYPRHHPNTVIPEYPCVVSAKYEFTLLTAKSNPFRTKYIAWLDIGYFRDLVGSKNLNAFTLYKPPKFKDSLVAFNQVYKPAKLVPKPTDILLRKLDWVGTGFFLAKASVMVTWAWQYMNFTECYLSNNLMNSDQQIIYAMFVDNSTCNIPLQVHLQIYHGSHKTYRNKWFYLGYLSKDEGEMNEL